ncbi:Probable myosin-binding protein 6 [Striga hermonthica]|uniref:Probable myosin-binding protein 6 n=1 Tax=Striga hermonthica TaxID=68872 RepID=A0A9N7NAB8_STRHE|nr:Probable myosin-binding protein 6 [Striga hermonthica]
MASVRSFVEQNLGKFPHFLLYAVLEWLVIILLFIDGIIAFACNEIARFFDLRIPCLICTRIDHVLVHRDPNFYFNDSICEAHKKDISTLAYCHVHKKLSDIRTMCKGCLLSFAAEKESDLERYKSLVGVLHKDVDWQVEDERKSLLNKKDDNDILPDGIRSGISRCTCCGDPLKLKASTKFNRSLSMNVPTPSPRASFFGIRNEEGSGNLDLPHIRYTELKLMSDTESEVLEEDDAINAYSHTNREDPKAVTMPLLPETDEINEETLRTPTFTGRNKFFGIPLSDSAQASPRWANRSLTGIKKLPVEKLDFTLMALYMELDEERSASAVAANNAMAMITRLQAEKAAVQMEALQYQRMMEEQAEYDQEAIQVLKDMIFKREEDMKALESELEMYREKYGQMKKIGSEICEIDDDEDYQDMKSQGMSSLSERSDEGGSSSSGNEAERAYDRSMENMEDPMSFDFDKERERLRVIEADNGFLKHAAMTLQRGDEGTKLLTEIAQHLRKLRQPVNKSPSEDSIDA